MIWKLNDDIWWGNADSPAEARHEVKAVLSLCDNIEFYGQQYNPLVLPATTRYFRLTRPDHLAVDLRFLVQLDLVLDAVSAGDEYPLLVHCYAGQHRAPNTAVYAAIKRAKYDGNAFLAMREKVLQLRPDVQFCEYGQSIDRECRLRCKLPLPHYDLL